MTGTTPDLFSTTWGIRTFSTLFATRSCLQTVSATFGRTDFLNDQNFSVAKTKPSRQESSNTTKINAQNANIGFINSGSGTVSNFSQTIGQNINEITKLVNSLREIAQQLPDAQRQETLVTLDDLQEDIDNPDKQKPERIKIRLGRLVVIAGTIAGLVAGAADFSNNVLELHEKLGFPVPIELNHPQLNHQLPPPSSN